MADRHLDIAREVLSANDRGRFTIPAAGQYPHQWNWDSALIALGWATIDPDRAWTELEALAGAQDPDSELIAHIAFTPGAQGYEPGPACWRPDGVPAIRGVDGRQISQISQPPVAATCLRLLHERHPRPDRLPALIEALHAWHRFWMTARDPARSGEPVIIHPWESGRDNAAEFASALAAVPRIVTSPARADREHVDARERPTDRDYEGYLSLVELGRRARFDQAALAVAGPLRVSDPAMMAILGRACEDLAALVDGIDARCAAEERAWAQRLRAALIGRLDPRTAIPACVDHAAGTATRLVGCAAPLCLLASGLPGWAVDRLCAMVGPGGPLHSPFGVRSLAPGEPGHDPRRYWLGPAWANITWLCALGAAGHRRDRTAAGLMSAVRRFFEHAGPVEYVHPDSGEPSGARGFAWTAALYLDVRQRLAG